MNFFSIIISWKNSNKKPTHVIFYVLFFKNSYNNICLLFILNIYLYHYVVHIYTSIPHSMLYTFVFLSPWILDEKIRLKNFYMLFFTSYFLKMIVSMYLQYVSYIKWVSDQFTTLLYSVYNEFHLLFYLFLHEFFT